VTSLYEMVTSQASSNAVDRTQLKDTVAQLYSMLCKPEVGL